MSEIASFLQNPTSNATIIIVAILMAIPQIPVIIKLIRAFRQTAKISATQDTKYPMIQEYLETMTKLNTTNETLLENHFKHEVPEMSKDIKEIKNTVQFIKDNHGNRLTRLETLIEK